MSSGKEAVVSRGELIEIGGSFRLPQIMEKSGCTLVEIGTTNRTTLEDYRKAANKDTGLFLKVHASNYSIVGFAERVPLPDLVELGQELAIPVLYDLGSGSLIPMDPEPSAEEALAQGADVICFSGDKLLGGPQAGIIVGKRQFVDPMKKDPFARVARICKLTLAALHATLLEYLNATEVRETIPTLQLISKSISEIEKSATHLARCLKKQCGDGLVLEVIDGESRIGGGSFPTRGLPTKLVAVRTDDPVDRLAGRLRLGNPPIVARVSNDQLLLDVRTIDDADHETIASALATIVSP
jgi:L-seryl-tRNA(Ser) seleniumtransferase